MWRFPVAIGGYHEQDIPSEAVKNLSSVEQGMAVQMLVASFQDSDTKKVRARREKLIREDEESKRRRDEENKRSKEEEHCQMT